MTEHITLSFSELRMLITKAARGAGLPWGLAEEAGWAADWLARRGLPAAAWATIWLQSEIEGVSGPVPVGVALSDRLATLSPATPETLPEGLVAPGYLLPFLHRIALRHGAIRVSDSQGTVLRMSPKGEVWFGPGWGMIASGWTLEFGPEAPLPGRPMVHSSVLDCLDGMALRTTVPPSDQSRRGAGAAADDND